VLCQPDTYSFPSLPPHMPRLNPCYKCLTNSHKLLSEGLQVYVNIVIGVAVDRQDIYSRKPVIQTLWDQGVLGSVNSEHHRKLHIVVANKLSRFTLLVFR